MEIKQLRYFVGIATAGSLTQAAEKLHVAQPALSQHILKLERALGERLMTRHSRGINLTEAGQRFLAHARSILEQIEQTQLDVADVNRKPRGAVRVGLPRSASDMFGIEMLIKARRLYPDVKISVIDRPSDELNEMLADNLLDLCLTFENAEESWRQSQPLYTENLCIAIPPRLKSRRVRGRTIKFRQIVDYPLALPTVGHSLRTLVDNVAMQMRLTLDIRFEIDAVQLLRATVTRNLACTILPLSSLMEPTKGLRNRIYVIQEPNIARVLNIVSSRRRPASRAVTAARDLIIQCARSRISLPWCSGVYQLSPGL
jgi:LysR family transcriptional regulator, nitrogen assimilation regulatory protein